MATNKEVPERMGVEMIDFRELVPPVLEPYIAHQVRGPKNVWYHQDTLMVREEESKIYICI